MKVLTVAICAYNMENYLAECLDSFLVNGAEKLEVLIMNDGSKDRTEEIAKDYETRYPDTFVLVNKENGGWGSNLNLAIQKATGKYFKEVDADDWVSKDVLEEIIADLEQADVDLYISDHTYWNGEESSSRVADWKPYAGSTREMKDVKEFYFPIWDAAFRTELVKEIYTDLPTHVLYTDTLLVQYLIPFMETVHFKGKSLYNYRLGRDGQSMNINSLFNHYKDLLRVWHESVEFYLKLPKDKQDNIHTIAKMEYTYKIFMDYLVRVYKMDKPVIRQAMKDMDDDLKRIDFLYKKEGEAKRIKLLRSTGYRGASLIEKKLNDH